MAEKPQPKPVRGATTRGGAMIVVSLMAGYSIVLHGQEHDFAGYHAHR